MNSQFADRVLKCADCHADFVFTAGEQIFFLDKQFRNDPKRCKPCKSRRSGLSAAAGGTSPALAGIARTETRTLCSDCGIETTVPFKPTQGRPVLCRQCFQGKARAAVSTPLTAPASPVNPADSYGQAATVGALTGVSTNRYGSMLSPDAAVLAVASMAAAPAHSSVATAADLASISELEALSTPADLPSELFAATGSEVRALELLAAAAEFPEA